MRRAFIIFRFSKFSCFYYFLKMLAKFSLAFIITLLRGVLIINSPVVIICHSLLVSTNDITSIPFVLSRSGIRWEFFKIGQRPKNQVAKCYETLTNNVFGPP